MMQHYLQTKARQLKAIAELSLRIAKTKKVQSKMCLRDSLKLYSFYLPYPRDTKKLLIGHLIGIEQITMPAGKYVLCNICLLYTSRCV